MTGIILALILGSIVGSFLNVCIIRLPKGESVVWPRSHCPKCRKKIAGYDNIPVLSYLLLKGRCRNCKQPISLRYLVVEILTALVFAVLTLRYGLSYDLFFYIVLACALIISTFTDIRERIIPDEVSIGGMLLGFVLSAIRGVNTAPFSFTIKPLINSLIGAVVGGGIVFLTGYIFDLVYFKILKRPPIQGETESMGGGDVKLMALVGAFLGWHRALIAFFVAPFFGLIFGLVNIIKKKDHTMPYGPFLSLGAMLALFYSDKISRFLFLR
jgi:leader peptidase (prepilin peptidase) / N-methyltransferase